MSALISLLLSLIAPRLLGGQQPRHLGRRRWASTKSRAAARSGTSVQSRCLPRPSALASLLLRQVVASLPTYKQALRGSGRDRRVAPPWLRGHRCRSGWPPRRTPERREEGL